MSFTVGKGETVALVGESGSGKTVSAMSILRLLPNSASHPTGEILFEGKDILKANEAQLRAIRGRRISIIFQEPMTTLNPLHTIEKQVGEIIKLHQKVSDQADAHARDRASDQGRHSRSPKSGSEPIRISFPAASGSA